MFLFSWRSVLEKTYGKPSWTTNTLCTSTNDKMILEGGVYQLSSFAPLRVTEQAADMTASSDHVVYSPRLVVTAQNVLQCSHSDVSNDLQASKILPWSCSKGS